MSQQSRITISLVCETFACQYPCFRSFVLIFLFHYFQSLFLHRTGIGTSFPQLLYFHIPLETTKVKDSTGKHYSPYFVLATSPQYVRNNSNQILGKCILFSDPILRKKQTIFGLFVWLYLTFTDVAIPILSLDKFVNWCANYLSNVVCNYRRVKKWALTFEHINFLW